MTCLYEYGKLSWNYLLPPLIWCYENVRKVNSKVQEEPQAEVAANSRHQEEEKK